MKKHAIAVVLASLIAACGEDGYSGTLSSSGGSVQVTATDAMSFKFSAQCTGYSFATALVLASDFAGVCTTVQNGTEKQNAKTISIQVMKMAPSGTAAITPGTYDVGSSMSDFAFVAVLQSGAVAGGNGCSSAAYDEAGSGTVTITSVDGSRIRGSVDVALLNGGKVTGTFDAPGCALTETGDACTGNYSLGPTTTTCVP